MIYQGTIDDLLKDMLIYTGRESVNTLKDNQ